MGRETPTIILTGGGSGGHLTPLIAVGHELKAQRPDIRLVYIGKRGDKLADIVSDHATIDQAYSIFAGKFRRYHSEGWRQILDIKTLFFNIRDVAYVVIGIMQACILMIRLKPTCIFIKGGFVGVPVGLAAAIFKKPFITHDSDAIPGLANRIVGRWAKMHATGMPKELYPYPQDKTEYTGVPVQPGFTLVTAADQAKFRTELKLPVNGKVLFVTGGGLGARRLNDAMASIAQQLLLKYTDLTIIQTAGHANYDRLVAQYDALEASLRQRVIIKDFITNLHVYSGAADVVVMRASATSMAEMAIQGKACILVPNPLLTGGHQTKNADAYTKEDAAKVVSESVIAEQGPSALLAAIESVFDDAAERNSYALNIAKFAHPQAASALTSLLLKAGGL